MSNQPAFHMQQGKTQKELELEQRETELNLREQRLAQREKDVGEYHRMLKEFTFSP
jgi:hypothetical protein